MKITTNIFPAFRRKESTNPVGLGDAVHAVAHPVAEMMDKFLKTDLANCKTCEERREAWNQKMPDIKKLIQ